ncbi:MAG: hypothetical protein A2V45_00445 [Candidatus Aminicenantes bacterium RBG_19FT_COMBO_58_17]|nr:MAG: hypothetical protein A2V45_00445 [Candidatus Aminicenantes bacterium RBG_19FT_COMBO_58_17]
MGILSNRFFDRLDEASFGDIQVWDFSFRSLLREYAWVFFLKAVLAHPVKTVRGLRRYRHFIREKKHPGPEYVRLLSIPDDAIFLQNVRARKSGPLIGLGFCLKPHEPNDSSASCSSGRANHDCLYLERGDTRPVCAGCVIHEIGRLALEKGCPVYIMTSAKDIARDFMLPRISRGLFPAAVLILCPFSVQAIILPLLICGVEMLLLSYASGSCADYGQWLKADRGIKDERTTIDAESRERLLDLLGKLEYEDVSDIRIKRYRRFHRSGNVFYPG